MSGKRRQLSPKVGYLAVRRDWDWSDSKLAATHLWNPCLTEGEARAVRDIARLLGDNRERIVRAITTFEIVEEGDDSKITPRA